MCCRHEFFKRVMRACVRVSVDITVLGKNVGGSLCGAVYNGFVMDF